MPIFDTSAAEYVVGPFRIPNRFFALLAFCVMSISNGFAWFEFDPVVTPTRNKFTGHISSATIQLLSSWQPIMFLILFVPITMVITQRDGLRRAMRIGSSCAVVGGSLKLFACLALSDTFTGLLFLHAGQILVAVGAPSVIGGVSALAGTYFPADERARATAAAILCNDLGGAVGYILSPTMASGSLGLTAVILFEMALLSVLLLLVWLVFPDAPRRRHAVAAVLHSGAVECDAGARERLHSSPTCAISTDGDFADGSGGSSNSISEGGGDFIVIDRSDLTSPHSSFKAQLRQLLSRPTPWILMAIFSWCSGGFVAWTSMFELMLEEAYDSKLIGTMSFVTSLGYVGGGLVAGYLIDKYFRKSMSTFISCALALACVATTGFTAVTPSFPETDAIVGTESPFLVFFFGALCGIGYGAATPVFFELLAEYAYPVDEAISGGVLSVMEAVGALAIYQVVARFLEGGSMNYAFAGGCAVCLVLSTFIDEQHNRPDDDAEEGAGDADVDAESSGCGSALPADGGEGGGGARSNVRTGMDTAVELTSFPMQPLPQPVSAADASAVA